jgi:hypothetical protein
VLSFVFVFVVAFRIGVAPTIEHVPQRCLFGSIDLVATLPGDRLDQG